MSIAVNVIEPRLSTIQITEDEIVAHLVDGRTISVPLAWSWRLSEATPEQRQNFEIIGNGQGIHWPDKVADSRTKNGQGPRFTSSRCDGNGVAAVA